MRHIAILGRQPELGIAELERTYSADAIQVTSGRDAVLLDAELKNDDLKKLGGSIKLAKVLTVLDTTEWRDVERYLAKTIPQHLKYVPEGKFHLGLSAFGLKVHADDINASSLRLKKIIKATGRSVRVVPNKAATLNSAQVLHNRLTGPTGWELIAVRNGRKSILAQTIAEQDIDAYAARDQARPARDAFVGMLPPKLAQIMIHLGTGGWEIGNRKNSPTILDPFCGTGVILQEALLMGFEVYGTDLSEKMVDYTKKNLDWLSSKFDIPSASSKLSQGDATDFQWDSPIDAVVAETYLGQPFSAPPSAEKLEEVRGTCTTITTKFLDNIGRQIQPGTQLCIAVPAWRGKSGSFTHLPILNKLPELGYEQVRFTHIDTKDLLYFRPEQVVARELLVLVRK